MGKPDRETIAKQLKALERILSDLRESWLFVEGKKDKVALGQLGCTKILTISGNLRRSCETLGADVEKVIILTDLDRRGDQLLLAAKDELEGCSKIADIETRRRLAGILGLRCFEDIGRKYDDFMEMAKEI